MPGTEEQRLRGIIDHMLAHLEGGTDPYGNNLSTINSARELATIALRDGAEICSYCRKFFTTKPDPPRPPVPTSSYEDGYATPSYY